MTKPDYFGRPVEAGDIVAFNESGYRNFISGEVVHVGNAQFTIVAKDGVKYCRDHYRVIKK